MENAVLSPYCHISFLFPCFLSGGAGPGKGAGDEKMGSVGNPGQ